MKQFGSLRCVQFQARHWVSNPSVFLYSDEAKGRKQKEAEEDEEIEETPQEKKLRLAKLYLEQLKDEGR